MSACLRNRPVRGAGLQGVATLALFCRPHALMRRSGRIFKQALGLLLLWGILEAGAGVLPAEAPAVAISHNASIVWPISDMVFRGGSFIKIKVEATTGLGTGDVRFFASTNLIGSVAQAPFNLIWQLPGGADGDLQLTAAGEFRDTA